MRAICFVSACVVTKLEAVFAVLGLLKRLLFNQFVFANALPVPGPNPTSFLHGGVGIYFNKSGYLLHSSRVPFAQ